MKVLPPVTLELDGETAELVLLATLSYAMNHSLDEEERGLLKVVSDTLEEELFS